MSKKIYDFIVLGGGLYGQTMTRLLLNQLKPLKILIIDPKPKFVYDEPKRYLVPLDQSYMFIDANKSDSINEGLSKLKEFSMEHKIDFEERDNLIFAELYQDKQRMKKLAEAEDSLVKISFEEAKNIEKNLVKQLTWEKDHIYYTKRSLIDINAYRSTLFNLNAKHLNSDNENSVDNLFLTNCTKVNKIGDDFKVTAVNSIMDTSEFTAKYVINTAGLSSLNILQQLSNDFKKHRQFFYNEISYKKPHFGKVKPSCVISSAPYLLQSGLSLYAEDDAIIFGNKLDILKQYKGLFQKIKQLRSYFKVVDHMKATEDFKPINDLKYVIDAAVLEFFNQRANFEFLLFDLKNFEKRVHSTNLIYDKEGIMKDILIHKEGNSIHLVNTNFNGAFTESIPVCEKALKLI